ncbi:T-complex protein 11 homolog [Elgaria multicarinata webbii]|uniref:T-complex protein 11 homolog n=1 Tax=Elgaria multicarinata webbii TaxID=159646 RepID=UPI002FCD13A4
MSNSKETTSSDCNDSQNRDCNPKKMEHEDSNLCPPDIPSSSPPQILSLSELMETANEVSKMTIAHEIVVNHDFKLQEVNFSPNSLESRMKETLHKAFWDSLREQLSKMPPDYSHAIKLLQEIKKTLLSLLLPRQTRLRSQIEEALDMELIKQEAEHGALDIPNLTTYVLGTMAMLCAPVRDEEVQKLRVVADPVHLLREIFRVLDLMKMDMVNFTIQTLRPHLQEHSVQYERKKFQELLNKLPGSLACTTEWLRKAAAEVSTSDLLSFSSTSEINGSPVPPSPMAAIHSPTAVLNQAYMDLLHWEPGKEDYPETLLMDKARLHSLQVEVNQLAIIAAVLLVSSSTCGSNVFRSSLGCGDRLKQVTKTLLEGLPDTRLEDALLDISSQIHQEVNRTLLQLGYPALSTDKATSLKGQLGSLADKDNAVRILIEQRIQTFLRHYLCPSGQNSKNLLQGLGPIQEELLEVGQRFGSLINHNRQVFGPYYSGILKKLLLQEGKSDIGTVS